MKQSDSKILTSKKTESAKLKDLSKIVGQHINTSEGIDIDLLTEALKLKAQQEQLESALKEVEKMLKPLRDSLVEQAVGMKTSKYDSIEYINDGKRLYVYPKNTKSGKYDEKLLEQLARKNKIYKKIFEPTVKINETELLNAMLEEKITPDEFRAITLQVLTDVAEMKVVAEGSGVQSNSEQDTDKNVG